MKEPLLTCRSVAIEKGGKTVLEGIDLDITQGEIFAMVGGDGTGKSALLLACAGISPPLRGEVRLFGLNPFNVGRDKIRSLRSRLGLVFQDGALISNMTIFQNLALPLRYHLGHEGAILERRVGEKMKEFGLEPFRDELPANVPAGRRKMAGVARATILGPEMLFCDEPFTWLDRKEEQKLLEVFHRVQAFQGAIILIMSDIQRALQIADRIGSLEKGGMKIREGRS